MGFIDYHGTKEDRYTEVLEYSRAQQEEDWKKKDEKKLSLWLRDLTGSSNYAQLNVEDLIKYVVVKYRAVQNAWKSLESLIKTDPRVDMEQLWLDFSLDLAARHLSAFPLTAEKRVKYLQAFRTKIFKLESVPSAEEHYRMVTENPKYRQYFAECFDPTWKGQHVYKWLRAGVRKNQDGLKLLDEFLDADRDLSLFIALYLHQVILPHDDAWMREAETERKSLSDIRGKIHRGTIFAPDLTFLKNPLYKAEAEEPKKAASSGGEDQPVDVAEEPEASVQNIIDKSDFESMKKAYKQAGATITGSTKNIVVGAVGTTAIVAASGGLAFAFAPAIATALVGEAAAGLSGAALVSYSLAAIGGGSLAAGGLGMAGGTAIITGGGALVGMLGGTGVSAATTLNLLADDGYVLSECCKLLTFSKVVLIDRFKDYAAVADIQNKIGNRLDDIQKQLEELSDKEDAKSDDKAALKERKVKIKVAKKSIKYLRNTSDALQKLVKKNAGFKPEKLLPQKPKSK